MPLPISNKPLWRSWLRRSVTTPDMAGFESDSRSRIFLWNLSSSYILQHQIFQSLTEPWSSCSASQEFNHSATAAPASQEAARTHCTLFRAVESRIICPIIAMQGTCSLLVFCTHSMYSYGSHKLNVTTARSPKDDVKQCTEISQLPKTDIKICKLSEIPRSIAHQIFRCMSYTKFILPCSDWFT